MASGVAAMTDTMDASVAAVAEAGLLEDVRVLPVPADGTARTWFEGEAEIGGRRVTLQVLLGAGASRPLPAIYLEPRDALGFLPHVLSDGYVCYTPAEGLVVDRRRPARVVVEAISRALRVLADGAAGRNREDFIDEFEVYWRRLPDSETLLSFLEPGDEVGWVMSFTKPGDSAPILARREADAAAFWNAERLAGPHTVRRILYLPLEPGTFILPPRHDQPFWTAADARQALLHGLSPENRERLRKMATRRPRATETVIVRLPRASSGATLFGLRFDGISGAHPLIDAGAASRVVPLRLERLDRTLLLPRGGADASLARRRALLVGGGAVGGYLAFELARAGVLDLTIVDPDALDPDNTFRHVLGRSRWFDPKAEALKAELDRQLPYVRVTAVVSSIEAALASGAVDLSCYDLVLFAVGDPTLELDMNARLLAKPAAPRAIFTWLEPYGIGGHALLVGHGPGGGCFECLYTPPGGGATELANRAAFAAPGQWFGKALSGCGSLHLPYGSTDAAQTAVLAVRLAIDALTGAEPGNPLRSWRGPATALEAAGFRASARHAATEEELHRQRYAHATPYCRACGAAGTLSRGMV
jgi:hypothetical protein